MDQRERTEDREEALRAAMDGRQAAIQTACPGIVQSFNAAAMTAVVQPATMASVLGPDGSSKQVKLPLLLDCPVQFPGGGGVTLTFPVKAGDECLIVFASRCIDGWWQSGGVQPPAAMRMHDLSDGFVLLGVRSKPRVLSGISTTAAQLRNEAGDTFVELNPEAQTLHLTAPGGATIDANTTINGTLHVTGAITCDADVTASGTVTGTTDVVGGGKHLKTHTHGGVQTGSGTSGGPT